MPRFVIVNDARSTELASKLATFRDRDGDAAMVQEYMQWQYLLPAEEPHTYGSLTQATESRDDLRREHRNEEINVYRLIADDTRSELLAACKAALAVLEDACSCGECGPCTIHAPALRATIAKATE